MINWRLLKPSSYLWSPPRPSNIPERPLERSESEQLIFAASTNVEDCDFGSRSGGPMRTKGSPQLIPVAPIYGVGSKATYYTGFVWFCWLGFPFSFFWSPNFEAILSLWPILILRLHLKAFPFHGFREKGALWLLLKSRWDGETRSSDVFEALEVGRRWEAPSHCWSVGRGVRLS